MEGSKRLIPVALLVVLGVTGCRMIGSEALEASRRTTPTATSRSASEPRSTPVTAPVPSAPAYEPPSNRGNMEEYEQSGGRYRILETSYGYDERGVASWYGEQFQGRPTSSGEPFDMHELSAAHRTLPIPSWVRVTNLANGRTIRLRINDRGPFADTDRRIIDVSYAAAVELGMVQTGTASVRVQAIEPWQYRTLEGSARR